MDRFRGRVIWFKGTMGFICPEGKKDGEADVFMHFTQIVMKSPEDYRKLSADDMVTFKIGRNTKGPMAIEIMKVEE